jgi:hypothetical protein
MGLKVSIQIVITAAVLLYTGCEPTRLPFDGYQISGPYTVKNLSVYLIHGNDQFATEDMLTLEEAVAANKLIVHETGSVNELAVENLSQQPVYIQSGDIVKGGRQDRTIQNDHIIMPNSGKVPVASFCVESGRWSKRGAEADGEFSSSKKQLASRELKLAARSAKSQGDVWSQVDNMQQKLSKKLGKSVSNTISSSSLQLTLEDADLGKKVKEYVDSISRKIEKEKKTIGLAVAINGQMSAMDIYENAKLFSKLQSKLIDAAATEALGEADTTNSFKKLSLADAVNWAKKANEGSSRKEDIDPTVSVVQVDNDSTVQFKTLDKNTSSCAIHKSVLKKSFLSKSAAW